MRLIDAESLRKDIEQSQEYKFGNRFHKSAFNVALDIILDVPTIDPVKHGRWIENDCGNGWHCSFCGVDYFYLAKYPENFNFCPMCGAKMDDGNTEVTT